MKTPRKLLRKVSIYRLWVDEFNHFVTTHEGHVCCWGDREHCEDWLRRTIENRNHQKRLREEKIKRH